MKRKKRLIIHFTCLEFPKMTVKNPLPSSLTFLLPFLLAKQKSLPSTWNPLTTIRTHFLKIQIYVHLRYPILVGLFLTFPSTLTSPPLHVTIVLNPYAFGVIEISSRRSLCIKITSFWTEFWGPTLEISTRVRLNRKFSFAHLLEKEFKSGGPPFTGVRTLESEANSLPSIFRYMESLVGDLQKRKTRLPEQEQVIWDTSMNWSR